MSFEQIVKNLQILKDCNRTKKQHFKVKAYNDAIIKLNVLESNTKICIDDIDKLSLGRKITDKVNYICFEVNIFYVLDVIYVLK